MATSKIPATDIYIVDESVHGLNLVKIGKIVYLRYINSNGLSSSGIRIPVGFKPKYSHLFTGKANNGSSDIWDQGFSIDSSTGILTARSANNNTAISVTWVFVTTVYVTDQ